MPFLSGKNIAIAAPAGAAPEEVVLNGVEVLKKWGASVEILPHVFAGHPQLKYLAAPDHLRAGEFTEAFLDEKIDIIWCVRGGYGCMRILDKIPWGKLHDNPTVVAGFSDITALHWAMSANCAGRILSAPMMKYLPESGDGQAMDFLIAAIGNEPLKITADSLRGKCASGKVVPGNLSLAAALCGTKYFPDLSGKIVALEEVYETPYRIDRMLTQLRLSGAFDACSGVLFGNFSSCGEPSETDAVLRDFALADDIVQETYVKIMEKASSYEKGTNARAWILSIARNLSIDIYRRRSFDCAEQETGDEENRFDEGSVLFSMEVKRALDTLDDEERQIVTMKVYAELKHKMIAKILDISEEACKKKYQRAIAKLRVLL